MKKSLAFAALSAGLFGLPVLSPSTAQAASIAACNNIDVDANATCSAEVAGGCTVNCTPVHFEAACAANLEASCDGSCTGNPLPSCTASCQGDCMANCNVQQGNFNCETDCNAQADTQCTGQCSSAGDTSQCTASCKAHFAAQCQTNCTGTPPSASCTAKCQGSCQGSCTASSSLQCQVNCQSSGYATCEANLQGGCNADCQTPSGALFCDGNYVDHNGNLQSCIDAIKAALPSVVVDASASGTSNCGPNGCEANGEASASASCAFSPRSAGGANALGAFGVLVGFGAMVLRRRRPR